MFLGQNLQLHQQDVSTNPARVAKVFFTDRSWLLFTLSEGMGVCGV